MSDTSQTGILISLDDEDAYRSNVVLDYTSRDFTAIRAQLIGLAKGLLRVWGTVGETSDFGTLLLELFSYMGDVMNFYIDRTASEAFLGTAVRRQSVLYIADMLGYTPIGQQSASVKLEFTLDDVYVGSDKVVLPVGTKVYNESNSSDGLIVFETMSEITLYPTLPGTVAADGSDLILTMPRVVSVFASEGVTVKDDLLGISVGSPMAEFILPHKGVIFNTVSIRSQEGQQTMPWTYMSDLSLSRPTQAAFTTFLDDQDNTHVLFGDNSSGRIPPVNSNLYVTYRYGVGAAANSLTQNTLTSIVASSVKGADLTYVTVRNPAAPIGGTDPESVDGMRSSIPRAAGRIKSRAVTLNDYADLALQVPGVAKAVSYGTVYTAVHVKLAPQNGQGDIESMTLLCAQVENYMKDKIMVGSTVYAEPIDILDPDSGIWVNVYIRILIYVTEGYNRTSVRLQVENLVRQALSFNSMDFGTIVSIGKVYRTAMAVQGVDYVQLQWLDKIPPTLAQDQAMAPDPADSNQSQSINVYDIDPGDLFIARIYPPLPLSSALVIKKELASNVAKLTTSATHTFAVGNTVDISGVDPTFNGRVVLTAVTPTTVSYAKTAANVTIVDAGGTITQVDPHSPESDTDFPYLDEDERIHDGMWTWAIGGVPGT